MASRSSDELVSIVEAATEIEEGKPYSGSEDGPQSGPQAVGGNRRGGSEPKDRPGITSSPKE